MTKNYFSILKPKAKKFFLKKAGLLSTLKSSNGSALVEFAIVAPIFIMLFLGVIELSVMLIIQNALDAAVRQAGRFGITGNSNTGQSRSQSIAATLQQTAVTYSLGLIDPTQLNVYASYSTNLQTDVTLSASNPSTNFGASGQTSNYLVTYNWNTHLPIFGNNGIVTLQAESTFVDESY